MISECMLFLLYFMLFGLTFSTTWLALCLMTAKSDLKYEQEKRKRRHE